MAALLGQKKEVIFLGHKLTGNKIQADPDKPRAIEGLQPPKNALVF